MSVGCAMRTMNLQIATSFRCARRTLPWFIELIRASLVRQCIDSLSVAYGDRLKLPHDNGAKDDRYASFYPSYKQQHDDRRTGKGATRRTRHPVLRALFPLRKHELHCELNIVARTGIEVGLVLERHTDGVRDRVLGLPGKLGCGISRCMARIAMSVGCAMRTMNQQLACSFRCARRTLPWFIEKMTVILIATWHKQ